MSIFNETEIQESFTSERKAQSMRTVLIVDDDDSLRQSLAECLIYEGFHVAVAANGQEALNYLQLNEHKPGLILLDLMMPVISGKEFRRNQLLNAELSKIPVILLSAGRPSVDLINEIAPQGVIKKPFDLDKLISIITKFCA